MMLHRCYNDVIAWLEGGTPIALGYQVDPIGGAAGKDDLAGRGRIDEPRDLLANLVVGGGGSLAKEMDPAVDIGVLFGVEPADGIDDGLGFLAGGGVVEIDKRLTAYELAEDREILSDPLYIEGGGGAAGPRGSNSRSQAFQLYQ
jgi:hypothetical protein